MTTRLRARQGFTNQKGDTMYAYGIGDRVEAKIPGGVTVVGLIVSGPSVDADGSTWFMIESGSPSDDGQRYDVRDDEITVVLDSESD